MCENIKGVEIRLEHIETSGMTRLNVAPICLDLIMAHPLMAAEDRSYLGYEIFKGKYFLIETSRIAIYAGELRRFANNEITSSRTKLTRQFFTNTDTEATIK